MITKEKKNSTDKKFVQTVLGAKRFSNFWWGTLTGLGGLGFFLTGFSSFLQLNLLPFIHSENILFFPQGLVMCFYGLLGLIFSTYIWLTIFWSIGEGFNEFDKEIDQIRIFRWGFPGKNRKLDFRYSFNEVQSIRIVVQDGLNPKRVLYLCLKGQREIPLTPVGTPMTLDQIEQEGAKLAKFLQVPLEGM